MLRLIRELKLREWVFAIIGIVFIAMQVFLDLKMPEYMTEITKIAQGTSGEIENIWTNGAFMLLCALGSVVCSIITSLFFVRISTDFSARLREKIYAKVQSFSMAEITKFSTASLITRSTNDVQQLQMFIIMGLQMIIKAPITAVWAIIKIAGKEWQWSVIVAVAVVFLLICVIIIMSLVTKKFKRLQTLTDNINQTTRENLSGIRVIRAYNMEDYQEEKFENLNNEFTKTNLFTGRTMSFINPIMSMVMNGISLAIYWVGAFIINSASLLEVGGLFADMVVFMSYGMQIISAFMMLTMVFMVAPRAFVSAKRINEVLLATPSVVSGDGVGETEQKGCIEFKNVYFRYPDAEEDVLTDISFKAEKGQTVAFIGATGSGKSTVVNLVSRFYDATSGEILIDGHNVKDYKKEELAKKIGYISQKAVLFSGDILSNINFGDNNASDEVIENATNISQSTDFIEMKDGGINSRVAQNGTNFSGGQKQRLSIARALAREAEIYIFDDTFSALDYKTDKRLRNSLKKQMKDSTVLIVAQRIGTIKDADNIIVLEDGRVVGSGKHKDLMKTCPAYIEIAKSQLSEEELKNA